MRQIAPKSLARINELAKQGVTVTVELEPTVTISMYLGDKQATRSLARTPTFDRDVLALLNEMHEELQ